MVNDAEVDLAHFVGIVIEQGDDSIVVTADDCHLFRHFALHGRKVCVVKIGIEQGHFVRRVDVTADADRSTSRAPHANVAQITSAYGDFTPFAVH